MENLSLKRSSRIILLTFIRCMLGNLQTLIFCHYPLTLIQFSGHSFIFLYSRVKLRCVKQKTWFIVLEEQLSAARTESKRCVIHNSVLNESQ